MNESEISTITDNIAVLDLLSYYKLKSMIIYESFIKWIQKNNRGVIKEPDIGEVTNIFDQIYLNLDKKVFLARWYPQKTESEYQALVHRLNAIKETVESLNL